MDRLLLRNRGCRRQRKDAGCRGQETSRSHAPHNRYPGAAIPDSANALLESVMKGVHEALQEGLPTLDEVQKAVTAEELREKFAGKDEDLERRFRQRVKELVQIAIREERTDRTIGKMDRHCALVRYMHVTLARWPPPTATGNAGVRKRELADLIAVE
jgi:hypothetical protein